MVMVMGLGNGIDYSAQHDCIKRLWGWEWEMGFLGLTMTVLKGVSESRVTGRGQGS